MNQRRKVAKHHIAGAARWRPSAGPLRRRLRFEPLEDRRMLATITVNSLADTIASDGLITLREAIRAANLDVVADPVEGVQQGSGADTIEFAPSLFAQGQATILLSAVGDTDANLGKSALRITAPLAINGPGAALLKLDASGLDPTPSTNNGDGGRVFRIDDGISTNIQVSLAGLTVTGGDAIYRGGGIDSRESLSVSNCVVIDNATTKVATFNDARGGGIYSAAAAGGAFVIENSTIANNSAIVGSTEGGGIYVTGSAGVASRISTSVLSGNTATSEGGGLSTYTFGARTSLTIVNTTISGNTGGRGGGAFLFARQFGAITVQSSLLTDNTATNWGGGISLISVFGDVLLTDSTLSGNKAGSAGGGVETSIDGGSPVRLTHSTITGNSVLTSTSSSSNGGGGIRAAALTIENCIIAGNSDNSHVAPDLNAFPFGPTSTVTVRHTLIVDGKGTGLAEAPVGAADANGNYVGGTLLGVIDPLMGPLANNGGPTHTHALLPGGPAINTGDASAVVGVGTVPVYDQRGAPFSRVVGGRLDMGAFEFVSNLAGDYNRNGMVDAADYTVWNDTFGSNTDLRADGSGMTDGVPDGVVNQVDVDFWKSRFGNLLAVGGGSGSGGSGAVVDSFRQVSSEPSMLSTSVDLSPSLVPAAPKAKVFSTAATNSTSVRVSDQALLAWLASRNADSEQHGIDADVAVVGDAADDASGDFGSAVDAVRALRRELFSK